MGTPAITPVLDPPWCLYSIKFIHLTFLTKIKGIHKNHEIPKFIWAYMDLDTLGMILRCYLWCGLHRSYFYDQCQKGVESLMDGVDRILEVGMLQV